MKRWGVSVVAGVLASVLAGGAVQAADRNLRDPRERWYWLFLADLKAPVRMLDSAPYAGIMVADVREVLEERPELVSGSSPETGAFVLQVAPDGPAARAGLQPGDVIVRLGERPLAGAGDFQLTMAQLQPDEPVSVSFVRKGQALRTVARVARAPEPEHPDGWVGATVYTLNDTMAAAWGLTPGITGALVSEVQEGSPAARSGLRPGDVIVEVDSRPVRSAQEAAATLREARARHLRLEGPSGARAVILTP